MTNTEKSITSVAAGITIALVIAALRANGHDQKVPEPVVIEETAEIPHIVLNVETSDKKKVKR